MALAAPRPSARIAILFLLVALGATALHGADPVIDGKGFNPNREYLNELPFEHIDPLTGNVLLTFTDLVLPGNAGLDLRVQRTYNARSTRPIPTPAATRSAKTPGPAWVGPFTLVGS